MEATLILPHQLFDPHPCLVRRRLVVLAEDPWFFREVRFHRQKLVLHRASLIAYQERCRRRGYQVRYLECPATSRSGWLMEELARLGVTAVVTLDPADVRLKARLTGEAARLGLRITFENSPGFLLSEPEVREYFQQGGRLFQTRFYVDQRRRRGILLEGGKPLGGRWTFDTWNRRRLPRGLELPPLPELPVTPLVVQARTWVRQHFLHHPGQEEGFRYPVTHEEAQMWFRDFLDRRLARFGDFEDAISRTEGHLFHSLLSPLLNIGLLTPREVLEGALDYARDHPVPLNSLEGFVRQVLGWREYVRAVYLLIGEEQRAANFFGCHASLPAAFYTAATGLEPVDTVLGRVLTTGYAHHIERLMVLGNVFLLCEVSPQEVYRWFMELFIDAYDWVMVPNVFGMSQFADGGRMMTKPYLSSSRYLRNMSDFPAGPWCDVWDGLFWRFIARHRGFFARHPRLAPLVRHLDRLTPERRRRVEEASAAFLKRLWP